MIKIVGILAVVCVFTFAGTVSANVIASWDLFGEDGDQVSTAGVGSPQVTALNMIRGADLVANSGSNSLNSKGWAGTEAGDYIQFGFDVAPGYQVLLNEPFLLATRSTNTGPGTIGVYTSVDGFATAVETLVQPSGGAFLNSSIDLSSLSPVSGTFRVRLIEIGDTQADLVGATSDGGTFRVADLYDGSNYTDTQFQGTLVPTPTVLSGILSLCALTLVTRRRRLRRR